MISFLRDKEEDYRSPGSLSLRLLRICRGKSGCMDPQLLVLRLSLADVGKITYLNRLQEEYMALEYNGDTARLNRISK